MYRLRVGLWRRRMDPNRGPEIGRWLVTWYCDTVGYLALVVLCLWPVGLPLGTGPKLAEAQGVVAVEPGRLPSSFMATETLAKLRGLICKSCPTFGRGKQRLCSDFSPKDVCHMLCGCTNLRQRCLDKGDCMCPLTIDEGCRSGSTEVCEFDDAVVCSTPRDVCLFHDERKTHCECRGGWTGENCQTCSGNKITDCQQEGEKRPDGPTASGLDFTFKAIIVACVAFVTVALLLAIVICLCRSGKLVCVTMSREEKNAETENKTKGMSRNQSVLVAARQPQSQHQYYHVAQYAVPDSLSSPVSSSTPAPSPRKDCVAYAEPNTRRPRQPISQADREDSNYYYKLEPTSSAAIVTYESVAHRVKDRVCPAGFTGGTVVVSDPCDDQVGTVMVTTMSPVTDAEGMFGTRLSTKPNHSGGVYDRLKRNMDITSDITSNYSHISLHGDL